jgi:hypothetical protein
MGDKRKRENRGRAKKPRRSGREAIKDPRVVDPANRPSAEEIAKKGSGGLAGNMERLVYQIIDMIKSGIDLSTCEEILSEEINPNTNKKFAPRFIHNAVVVASGLIRRNYEIQQEEVVGLHIKRYNEEITRLLNIKLDRIPPQKRLAVKVEAYMNCLDTLHQKEKLLGMHTKDFKIIINNEETTIVREKKPKLDISKLTLAEKIELNALLEKSRKSDDDEVCSVILKKDVVGETIDIEAEVIVEKSNIDRMENREPQKAIDDKSQGQALMSLEDKLRETLRKRAQEEFLKAGSKTADSDNPEEKVIVDH